MRHFGDDAARQHLRVAVHVVEVVDRAAGHAHCFQLVDPERARLAQHHLGQQRHQFLAVLDAQRIGGVALVQGQVGAAAHLDEFLVLAVVAGGDDDVAVGTGKGLVRHDVRMRIAPALGGLAAVEVVAAHIGQHGHLHVEQRHVDVLAFAAAVAVGQRRHDGDGGVHAGHQVGQRHAGFLRAAAGQVVAFAGHRHQAAHALDQEIIAGAVGVRAILAETGHRAIDDIGLDGLERLVIEAVAFQLADLVVFQHHVAVHHQFAQQGLAVNAGDVDRHRALAAVGGQVIGGFGGVVAVGVFGVGRAPGAGVVAVAGAFDLDHVGAQVGQVLRTPGAGQHAAQVQHAEVAQRFR